MEPDRVHDRDGGTAYDGGNRIAVVRPDGTRRRFVLNNRRAWRNALEFSPDGPRLLYHEAELATCQGQSRWCVLELASGHFTTLKDQPIDATAADTSWAPSGRRIGYLQNPRAPSGERTPPTEARSIRPDGTGDQLLFSLPFDEQRG